MVGLVPGSSAPPCRGYSLSASAQGILSYHPDPHPYSPAKHYDAAVWQSGPASPGRLDSTDEVHQGDWRYCACRHFTNMAALLGWSSTQARPVSSVYSSKDSALRRAHPSPSGKGHNLHGQSCALMSTLVDSTPPDGIMVLEPIDGRRHTPNVVRKVSCQETEIRGLIV